ncbi:type II toxin-antitoxin system PemK/MazF family toxin [Bacillus ectoiniformans]|uniref:type II toxin-antitoxin system PemK/MazF family toxin n=1 Tax=Bacillus ectoiniformans TaxID=1494429 RepID=UPI001EF8EC65|nr:type II toxin-antitoxin system PemK/MazF family toxin [Bacillus ectoiniformans]
MMYSQGDILLLPILYTNLTTNKQWPVLVLSNNTYNQNADDIIVAAITSKLSELDFSIIIHTENLTAGKLKKTSAIRADKLYTLSKHIVKKKFGQVHKEISDEVIVKVNELL